MELTALDATKLNALMVAGAVFALLGLWLMFRPQAEGHGAVVKLFGLEFQASSAGLLVFLVGAGFLALPIFVPQKPSAVAVQAAQGPGSGPVVPIIVPEGGPEAEPNDHPRGANLIEVGKVYSGEVSRGEMDFFRMELDPNRDRLRYVWRVLSSAGRTAMSEVNPSYRCSLDVLDRNEVNLKRHDSPGRDGEAKSGVVEIAETTAAFFKVVGTDGSCTYEIETRYEDA